MTSMLEQAHAVDPQAAAEKFNAGETIIGHVSNSSLDHPLIHLPKIFGIDFSVTKHVFMLWVVAAIVFLIVITVLVRRYLKQTRLVPTGTDERARDRRRVHPRRHRAGRTSAASGSTPGRRCCSRSSCSSWAPT